MGVHNCKKTVCAQTTHELVLTDLSKLTTGTKSLLCSDAIELTVLIYMMWLFPFQLHWGLLFLANILCKCLHQNTWQLLFFLLSLFLSILYKIYFEIRKKKIVWNLKAWNFKDQLKWSNLIYSSIQYFVNKYVVIRSLQ